MMGIKVHMLLQGLLILAQPTTDPLIKALGVSPEWAEVLHTFLGGCNGLLAWFSHGYNPDGTPASVAFVKPPAA